VTATPDLWQSDAVHALRAALKDDDAVKALVLIGSCASRDVEPDPWSDVDVVVVVEDAAVPRFFPTLDWLDALGEVYASSLEDNGPPNVIRAYFTDGRRLDAIVLRESTLATIDDWGLNLFCYGARPLFSRCPALDRALERGFAPSASKPPPAEHLARISDDFWFKAMLAVHKVARNDLLVALHLSLDLIRDCCVLGMLLRDRQTGTNHHRDGSAGEPFVDELTAAHHAYTAHGILRSIEQSSIIFDGLSSRWCESHRSRRQPLLRWIERVRRSLPQEV